MGSDDRASVRMYTARFGFERVAEALNANKPEYVAVYGSLREGLGLPDRPELDDRLRDCGRCVIRGLLYDLGDYPGMKVGEGRVIGELYELSDLDTLRALDRYEQYDALHPSSSLYIRRAVRLVEPQLDAWVYYYHPEVEDSARIPSGDWAAHLDAREGGAIDRAQFGPS